MIDLFVRIKVAAANCLRSVVTCLYVVLLSALLVESGYRVYLYQLTKKQAEAKYKPSEVDVIGAYGDEPWIFDRQQGFVFNQKPWLTAIIEDGEFSRCLATIKGNRYGNIGKIDYGYEGAELKIMIVGSSYSMVIDEESGEVLSDVLTRQLSRNLKRNVHVLNFSRDATGILSYLDIAAAKVPELKPDIVLMLTNVTALIYKRHWRKVLPDGTGGRQLYFMLTPDADPNDRLNAFPQGQLVNDAVTDEWCSRMKIAKDKSDNKTLKYDPIVKTLLAQQHRRRSENLVPEVNTDSFKRTDISFVKNLLKFKDPFHGVERFMAKTPYSPLALNKYSEDPSFLDVIDKLKASGVPLLPIHLPTLPEMRKDKPELFAFEEHGVPAKQGESLSSDLQDKLGQKWVHLFKAYPVKLRAQPLRLVHAENDSHPSPLGTQAMADAIELTLNTHPATAHLMRATASK